MLGFDTAGRNPLGSPAPFETIKIVYVFTSNTAGVVQSHVSSSVTLSNSVTSSNVAITTSASSSKTLQNSTVVAAGDFPSTLLPYIFPANTIGDQMLRINSIIDKTNSLYTANTIVYNLKSDSIPSSANNFVTKSYTDEVLTTQVSDSFMEKVLLVIDWND